MNALIASLAQYAVPVVVLIVGYVYHIVAVHIPAERRAYIEKWAKVGVAKAEQLGAGKSNAEKKQMAMDTITDFCKEFDFKVPSSDILSSFIEAAVNALPVATPATP